MPNYICPRTGRIFDRYRTTAKIHTGPNRKSVIMCSQHHGPVSDHAAMRKGN